VHNSPESVKETEMSKGWWTVVGILVAFGVALSLVPLATAGEFSFGFGAGSNATAKDVGLPFYPGAWPHKKKEKNEESSANIWGSFGAFGLKVVVVELDSNDAPGKVAPFYRNALGRYGRLLDCSAGQPRPPVATKNSDRLDCHDDHVAAGEFLFKAGVKKEFRIVGIEPQGQGSKIALVYIQIRGDD